MDIEQIIIAPIITEKASVLREENQRKYVLKVDRRANKIQIMQAFEKIFKVKPTACNVINVHGKKRSNVPYNKKTYMRGYGRTAAWKKAIVILPEGKKINELDEI